VDRARVLPAFVEILLLVDDLDAAAQASEELDALAEAHPSTMLSAIAHYARGTLLERMGDPVQAITAFRAALRGWQELEAPYETAKTRAMIGLACQAIGDHDTARLEFDAARSEFGRLGANPDLAWLDQHVDGGRRAADGGLTGRELEVLTLVASGATNKAIAAELYVSERTVDRHVSNIFSKLAVTTRTAAATYAHEHGLL
jgi:DNA-binding NarL/FixJ family response regulator